MTISQSDIETQSQTPKKVSGDEGSVEERGIDELIKGDRYAATKGATKPPFGMRIAKLKFGNSVS